MDLQETGQRNYLIEEADRLKISGAHKEAIKLCEKILTEDLDNQEAYEEIGDNYLSLKKYHKAKKALIQSLRINPESANTHYLLGFTFSAIGDWKDSIEHLEKADLLYPNHPEILRCLGWSIFHGTDRKHGLIILERALNINANDALILSDLGICYLNEKNFDRATILFNKVLKLDPNNQKIHECLFAVEFFKKEFKKLRDRKEKEI